MGFVTVDWNGGSNAFQNVLAQIKAAAGGASCSVLLVVACDVDALCAAAVLASILAADCIAYKIEPVRSLEDVLRIGSLSTGDGGGVRHVFFVGCGASLDIVAAFGVAVGGATVFVLDAHRPVHLANIFENDQVFVFDDGAIDANVDYLKELYQTAQYFGLEASLTGSLSDASDVEDEVEEDAENDAENVPNRIDEDSETEAANDRQAAAINDDATAAKKGAAERRTAKTNLCDYYTAAAIGTPASTLAYSFCSALAKDRPQHVWSAVVGVAALRLHRCIDSEQYAALCDVYREETQRISAHLSPPVDANAANESGSAAYHENFRDGSIDHVINEPALFMLRHWSLMESMKHADGFAARLMLWKEKGLSRLSLLLAKMAIPLRECAQAYSHLDFSLKASLVPQLQRYCAEFDVDDGLFCAAFVRTFSYGVVCSAAECVYALEALLHEAVSSLETAWKTSFFNVFSFLEGHASCESALRTIKRGISTAIAEKKAVNSISFEIMSRQLIKQFKRFRLIALKSWFTSPTANCTDSSSGSVAPAAALESDFILPPRDFQRLQNIAIFVIEVMKSFKKTHMPLLFAIPFTRKKHTSSNSQSISSTDTKQRTTEEPFVTQKMFYMLAYPIPYGIDGTTQESLEVLRTYNESFLNGFKRTAATYQADVMLDGFEGACHICLSADSLMEFVADIARFVE